MNALQTATNIYRSSGLNVLPAIRDEKRPCFANWKQFQTVACNTPINDEIDAVCVVCGGISGNLEILDFDYQGASFDDWKALIDEDLFARLLVEKSQNGGYHVAYRCVEPVDKNAQLCEVELHPTESEIFETDDHKRYTSYKNKRVDADSEGRYIVRTIETRGVGGIAIIAPTRGYCVQQNSWETLPTITAEERLQLLRAAQSLTEIVREPKIKSTVNTRQYDAQTDEQIDVAQYLRDDDAARRLLIQRGWQYVGEYTDDSERWRRPGKTSGVSASYHTNTGMLYIWTSNSAINPLQPNRTYTPLQLLAAFEFSGDEKEAARSIIETIREQSAQLYTLPFTIKRADEIQLIDDGKQATPSASYATIYDVPFPESCINPGGYLERVIDYTDAISQRVQRRLAFGAALTTFGHILARRVATGKNGETSPALYTVAIAPPSSGKSSGLNANRNILNLCDDTGSRRVEYNEEFESVQIFWDKIEATSKQFLMMDEFGAFLTSLKSERSNGCKTRLIDAWLKIYSQYSNESFIPSVSVRKEKSALLNPIWRPAFSLYGVTNFAEFRTAFCGSILKNGFIARVLFIVGDNKAALKFDDFDAFNNASKSAAPRVPKSIEDEYKRWLNFNDSNALKNRRPVPVLVPFKRDAYNELVDYAKAQDALYIDADETVNLAYKTLLGRSFEKTSKYALLFAASTFGPRENKLSIDVDAVRKAIDLNRYEHEIFKHLNEAEMAENEEESAVLDVKKWLATYPAELFTQSQFTRKFQRFNAQLRRAVLSTLIDSEIIAIDADAVIDDKGKTRPAKIYKILKRGAVK